MSDNKYAKAIVATARMDDIILERYLTDTIPKSNKFFLKQVYKFTGYKFYGMSVFIILTTVNFYIPHGTFITTFYKRKFMPAIIS